MARPKKGGSGGKTPEPKKESGGGGEKPPPTMVPAESGIHSASQEKRKSGLDGFIDFLKVCLVIFFVHQAYTWWTVDRVEDKRKAEEARQEELKKNPPPPTWQLKMWAAGQDNQADTYWVRPDEIGPSTLRFSFSSEKGYTRVFNPIWKNSFRVGAVESPGILCQFVGDTPLGASGGYCFFRWHTPGEILQGSFWRAEMQSGRSFEELQKSTKLEELQKSTQLEAEGIRKNAEFLKEGGNIILDSEVQLWRRPLSP